MKKLLNDEVSNVSIRKILGVDEHVANPKKDGIVPKIGSVVKLHEKKVFYNKKVEMLDIGEYTIVNITKFLVICDKVATNSVIYSTSFKISDFTSGIITFTDMEENVLSIAE